MSWLDSFKEIRSTDWSQVPEPQREEKAREVVTITAYASAAAAMVPVPLVDLALLIPFHSAMVMTVGQVLGRPVTDTEAKRVVLELGAVAGVTVAARAGLTALKKLVLPGVGGVLAAPASFAATWALGRVTITYFQNPHLSRDELRTVFKDAFKEAGQHFSKETFERFRKEHDEVDVPASDEAPAAAEAATSAQGEDLPQPAPRPGAPLSGIEDEPNPKKPSADRDAGAHSVDRRKRSL